MDGKAIIEEYINWIKNNSFAREVQNGNYCAITTPFVDRHNDHIDIYITKTENGGFRLTDGGDTISDLITTGTIPNTPKRKQIIKTTLNGFGVMANDEELYVESSSGDLPRKKHALIQAILAVNDMYMMSSENAYSFFKEDVAMFFLQRNIPVVPDIKIAGKSGYDHNIDFVIPRSSQNPEKLIRTLNKPTKDQVFAIIFSFSDIASIRLNKDSGSEQIVLYNNEYGNMTNEEGRALKQYGIKSYSWEEREKLIENIV